MSEQYQEVPWPDDPECMLDWDNAWDAGAVGYITFISPCQGWRGQHRTSLPVTRHPGGYNKDSERFPGNVWEWRQSDPGYITTHPSIEAWCCGCHWHSGNPVQWRVVERLGDEEDGDKDE